VTGEGQLGHGVGRSAALRRAAEDVLDGRAESKGQKQRDKQGGEKLCTAGNLTLSSVQGLVDSPVCGGVVGPWNGLSLLRLHDDVVRYEPPARHDHSSPTACPIGARSAAPPIPGRRIKMRHRFEADCA
jgi:hypothetical protein